jgi:hypothetical protein
MVFGLTVVWWRGRRYYAWGAAAPWVLGRALFGSGPDAATMDLLAAKHPLVATLEPQWGARAHRPKRFAVNGLSAWLGALVAADPTDPAAEALTPLAKAPRLGKGEGKGESGKDAKGKGGSPSPKPTGKADKAAPASGKATKRKVTRSSSLAQESGAAARKRRLAEEAEKADHERQRATREGEVIGLAVWCLRWW